MKKVLIPTKLDKVAADILNGHGGYLVIQDAKTPLEELIKAHPDTHAMIVRSEKVPAGIIDALPQLKVIVRAGAGFDKIREVYDSSKFGIEGTHVTYCFNIDLFDAYHFGIKLDLTVILMTMSGDLSGWFYDYFFKGTPSAGDVVALPKDPPLPPRYN